MTIDDKRLTIRLPKDLYKNIEKDTKELNISASSVIRIIISKYYKQV